MSSQLEELLNQPDLSEILSRPTEIKQEEFTLLPVTEEEEEEHVPQPSFVPAPKAPEPSSQIEEPEEPYDAERNARSLVYGLQAIDAPVLNTVGVLKVRKSVGGKKVINSMRDALIKEMEGKDLTETDKRLIKNYEVYEKKMNLLGTTLLPDTNRTENLIKAAIPYCEETKLNVNPALGFYGQYLGDLVSKITTILLT